MSYEAEREALLDRAEQAAQRCRGGSVSNPRYFAEMLAGCAAANWRDEQIALEEVAAALERIARRQRLADAQEYALYAAAELEHALNGRS